MTNIKTEIERLYKIYYFDSELFLVAIMSFTREMIVNYLSIDDKNIDFYQIVKLLDVNFQINYNCELYNESKSLIKSLENNYIKLNLILKCKHPSIHKKSLVRDFYRLSQLLKRLDCTFFINEIFSEECKEFSNIPRVNEYQDDKIDKNNSYTDFLDFSKINNNLNQCKNFLKGFKNTSLKYDETHIQYQKRYWALSDIQESIINEIFNNLKGVHLVEGIAGSGKSLVLLKLCKKINDDLSTNVIFLTYSKSLVRFDKRGLNNLNFDDDCINKIRTADSYFIFLLDQLAKRKKVFLCKNLEKYESQFIPLVIKAVDLYNQDNTQCSINPHIIFNEIENSINLYYMNKKSYITLDNTNIYSGKAYKLSTTERLQIWKIMLIFNVFLERRVYIPKNYSIVYLIKLIDQKNIRIIKDYIIVDEVQDLSLAQIILLYKISNISLILSGDINQSIYQAKAAWEKCKFPFDFKKYKLEINYRNSAEIKIFSQAYLNSFSTNKIVKQVEYNSNCTGLRPRLFMRDNVENTIDLMIDKIKMDIDEFNLELSDILIVCVSQYILEEVEKRISLPICRLKDTKFNESKINISSMYSSKGTGFPYMYFFLSNKIYIPPCYDEETRKNLMKKLIYVSITRSMNSLNIFIPTSRKPLSPIKNLIDLF